MKRISIFLFALLLVCVCLPVCVACGNSAEFTREEAAVYLADKFNFTGGENGLTAKDLTGSKNTEKLNAVLSRGIFDQWSNTFEFRPNDGLTKYELAKVSLNTYAALIYKEFYNLDPGKMTVVKDIENLSPESKWYIYAALDYGFVALDKNKNFKPDKTVDQIEFERTIGEVAKKAGVSGCDYADYKAAKLDNYDMTPKPDVPLSEKLKLFDATQINRASDTEQGLRIALSTFQGLVNKESIQLFVDFEDGHLAKYGGMKFYSDLAIQYKYFKDYDGAPITEIGALFDNYKEYIKSVVVYDPDKRFTINAATDYAAALGAFVVTPDILETVKNYAPQVRVYDLRELDFLTQMEAQKWSYETCFPHLRRDILAYCYYGSGYDLSRDYNISMKVPTIWIPGPLSKDYDIEIVQLCSAIMQKFPANIPIYGNQPYEDKGMVEGLDEVTGVTLTGKYAKYSLVWNLAGNESFFSGIPVQAEELVFNNKAPKIDFEPDKKYIAIAMADSGESTGYLQWGFLYYQWMQDSRGEMPYNYCYTPANADQNPLLQKYIIDTATDNDYFFCGVSGLGYIWAFDGYGSGGLINDQGMYMSEKDVFKDYYEKTNEVCGRYGLNSMEFHSYVVGDKFWSESDYKFFEENIAKYLPNIEYYWADCPRILYGQLTKEQNIYYNAYDQIMFHCATSYNPYKQYQQEVPGMDADAIKDLVDEIVLNTQNGANFYYIEAFSWFYGPDRIKEVLKELDRRYPGEYIPVTGGQMNNLYRQANNK